MGKLSFHNFFFFILFQVYLCFTSNTFSSKPEENEAFANLKQLLIITPEEELLQFLKVKELKKIF
jgi:hypothetical protein